MAVGVGCCTTNLHDYLISMENFATRTHRTGIPRQSVESGISETFHIAFKRLDVDDKGSRGTTRLSVVPDKKQNTRCRYNTSTVECTEARKVTVKAVI